MKEVVDVLDDLARYATGGVIVATHSLEFLGNASRPASPYLVTNLVPSRCGEGISELSSRAEELGLSVGAVLSSTRAVLLVEGKDDKWAYSTFTNGELDRSFVSIMSIHGMLDANRLIPQMDLLFSLDIPVYLALDHVRRSLLVDSLSNGRTKGRSTEEIELLDLHRALDDRSVAVAPFAKVDVFEALPDELLSDALEALGSPQRWPGWKVISPLLNTAFETDGTKFKDAFLSQTGVPVHQVVRWLRQHRSNGRIHSPELLKVARMITSDLSEVGAERTVGITVLPRASEV